MSKAKYDADLLRKVAVSGRRLGMVRLVLFLMLPLAGLVSSSLILERVWVRYYSRGHIEAVSRIIEYVVLVAIMLPFSICFARASYKVGGYFGFSSLRLVGMAWFAIAAESVILVPFAYQNAQEIIALCEVASANGGVAGSVAYVPLVLPIVEVGTSWIILLASSTLLIGAIEMRHRTSINSFVIAIILSLASLQMTALNMTIILISTGDLHLLALNNNLAVLTFVPAMIAFSAGMDRLCKRGEKKATSTAAMQ